MVRLFAITRSGELYTGYTGWVHPMGIAILTMTLGNLAALRKGIKRMLAYSSIAHAGYLLIGLIAMPVVGDAAWPFRSTSRPTPSRWSAR